MTDESGRIVKLKAVIFDNDRVAFQHLSDKSGRQFANKPVCKRNRLGRIVGRRAHVGNSHVKLAVLSVELIVSRVGFANSLSECMYARVGRICRLDQQHDTPVVPIAGLNGAPWRSPRRHIDNLEIVDGPDSTGNLANLLLESLLVFKIVRKSSILHSHMAFLDNASLPLAQARIDALSYIQLVLRNVRSGKLLGGLE